ncbi:MAG: toll/interleukin-1 receptor domain-containing protein, partial [Anaerolineae bacterium]|nr:toll/interleukin-1 receptor domain-containing protein [Anaerolineae bacterium]
MTDVFVSYSRKDKTFVQKLLEALTRAERDAWVDWEDIPRAADWLQEIYKGIDEAENFLFVVSPNSLTSEVCAYELRHAIDQKKRIIPLILQQIKDETLVTVRGKWMDQPWEQTARDNWKHLQSVNWLMFDDDAQFDSEFAALLTTIEQDYAHVQSHTRFALRAKEWEKRHRDRSSLLIGSEIDEAEAWLQQAASLNKQPPPTAAHQLFIAESRRLDDERRAQEAEQERRTRALEAQTQAAALENERLGKRSRQFRLAAALLGIVGVLAVLATIVSVNQTSTALSEAQAANAQVTQAGQTLTPILATLQAG